MKDIIKNQKLFFISLIGIVVVSLVMGTTYAYQTLQVDYEEGSSSNLGGNGLQTPKLEVNFNVTCKEGKTCDENNDNYNRINLTNMPLLPDYKTADYTEFTLTNNSTSDVAYQINLINIINSPNLATSDFKYTITEIEDGKEFIKYEGDFSLLTTNKYLLNPEAPYAFIEKEKSKKIRIYLWLKITESDQNDLENTSFQAKVEVTSLFKNELAPLSEKVLLSAKNALQTNNSTRTLYNDTFDITNITTVSTETDRMLLPVEDDYGTSYVFRGNVKDNYVKFAGFSWRIVRINGDGSVRLILDGTLDKVKREGQSDVAGGTVVFNIVPVSNKIYYVDNAHLGYMYGLAETTSDANRCLILENDNVVDKISNSDYNTYEKCKNMGGAWTTTAYEATHANVKDSTIKKEVDKFYENYIESDIDNYHYQKYLSDSLFCADKTMADITISNITNHLGYGMNPSYYATAPRIRQAYSTPSLKCFAKNIYSNYTSVIQKNTDGVVNDALKYPIALLNADELSLAGAYYNKTNQNYYLYNSNTLAESWSTMTPYAITTGDATNGFVIGSDVAGNSYGAYNITYKRGVRPVINLRSDLLSTGDGTIESPYEVMLAPDSAGTVPEEEMVTFKFVGKDNISETSEYTVRKGTTFQEFFEEYDGDELYLSDPEVTYTYVDGDVYYFNSNCKSENGTSATGDSIIENGSYICKEQILGV